MTDNLTYKTDKELISQEKMQFYVYNRHPKYSPEERETVAAEIQQQLFKIFSKNMKASR